MGRPLRKKRMFEIQKGFMWDGGSVKNLEWEAHHISISSHGGASILHRETIDKESLNEAGIQE